MEKLYFWGHSKRYNDFPTYFRKKFKNRVQKISVDAGFTCPNRDGSKGLGGCSYCNNKTFKPTYCNLKISISRQIQQGIDFFAKKYNTMQFIAYFQAYSNTYAPLINLKELYEEALIHPKIIGLSIATRPDCIDENILEYLSELSKKYYVIIELGIESHLNETLNRINRGHSFEDSIKALELTRKKGIRNCAHLILGLPGESKKIMIEQAKVISKLPIDHIKLHQLQIHKGTVMEQQYHNKPEWFNLFNAEEYIDFVVDYLEVLNPEIIVERFISQAPPEMLVAPKWGLKNFEIVDKVEKRLKLRQTWQGRLFKDKG